MKKFLAMLFFVSVFCPVLSAELFASDGIPDAKMMKEITQSINNDLQEGQNNDQDVSLNASEKAVARIVFTQTLGVTDSYKDLVNNYKDCVAVIIDDAWAIASTKCRLSVGDETRTAGQVTDVNVSNFRIELNKKLYKVTETYELKNVFLFRLLNENENPLLINFPKARLFFVPQKAADARYFADLETAGGEYKINRTDRNTPAYDAAHDRIEDNFQPYKTGRTLYTKGLNSVMVSGNNVTVTLDWIKAVRAGDPLFYIANGKEYLLGFGKAVNLNDRNEEARTYEVSLLTDFDRQEILDKITTIDAKAAKRIEKNIK